MADKWSEDSWRRSSSVAGTTETSAPVSTRNRNPVFRQMMKSRRDLPVAAAAATTGAISFPIPSRMPPDVLSTRSRARTFVP